MKYTFPFLLLAAATCAQAQITNSEAGPPTDMVYQTGGIVMAGAPLGAIGFVAHEFSFRGGKPVTGAPYSADQVTEHIQTLADGNRITNTTTTHIYRDSQGRVRTDASLPALAGGPTPPPIVTITDPVAGVTYALNPMNKTAQKMPSKPIDFAKLPKVLPLPPFADSEAGPITVKVRADLPKPDVKKEDLGTQEIGGVMAKGTRYTNTIPAGAIGNEQPIQTVTETWYSPDLQEVIKSTNTDPRMGQTTMTFSSLNRGEPDPSLFQVPADYTISDSKIQPMTTHAIGDKPQ